MDGRTRRRREKHETYIEPSQLEYPAIRELDRIAEREALKRALSLLSSGQREVLLMHHALGLDFGEIAGVLGILRNTAKLRAHRAIKNLRKILGVTNQLQEQNN